VGLGAAEGHARDLLDAAAPRQRDPAADEPCSLDTSRGQNRRLREWLEILDLIWYGEHPVHFDGEFYSITGTMTVRRMSGHIPIAMSGSSPSVRRSLVEHGNSYLLFGAPPEQVAAEIQGLRSTPGHRDHITVGLRVHVVVRPTEAEAWAAAEDIVSRVDPRARELVAAGRTDPASQRAVQQALAGAREQVVSPNLWAGIGTARFGVATALVGEPEQIADRLEKYAALGVGSFILSGHPKLEEAARFGQLVTPLLRRRGLL
jgi:alkanesulfonate monooxygenase